MASVISKGDIDVFINYMYKSKLVAYYAVFTLGELRSALPAGP